MFINKNLLSHLLIKLTNILYEIILVGIVNSLTKVIEKDSLNKKVKILFAITLSSIGGAQKVLYDILSSLPEDKYDISLVTSINGKLTDWINKLNIKRTYKIKIVTISNIKREISPVNDILALLKLYNFIKKQRFDIVHCHSSKMCILGTLAAFFARVPKMFITVHGWGINKNMSKITQKLLGKVQKWVGKLCTRIVCVSNSSMEIGIKNNWIKNHNSCVIYNGCIDYSGNIGKLRTELNLDFYTPIIGTVMRLDKPKDPLFNIMVLDELKKRGYKVKLVIIGDGPLKKKCEDICYNLGLNSDVFLMGYRDDVRDLIIDFNIFTLFSESEALPVSIIEAMMASKPVVASNVGGIPELISNGENGYLLDELSIQKASDTLAKLLLNPYEVVNLGVNSKKIALKKFNIINMVSEYEKIYNLNFKKDKAEKKN